ncbi:hypothetical protein BT67DRAFT_281482 [Trichocladium antarcticum]|uniref:Uncharacterized protein n=1 Tax=Trichocladium antarcticum TaxID=1450529 RepID=A0AAN6ZDY4_9PEZI|nr:hypothetical protein BT67DRAFT_281482 [Trichocladium antarcticum]
MIMETAGGTASLGSSSFLLLGRCLGLDLLWARQQCDYGGKGRGHAWQQVAWVGGEWVVTFSAFSAFSTFSVFFSAFFSVTVAFFAAVFAASVTCSAKSSANRPGREGIRLQAKDRAAYLLGRARPLLGRRLLGHAGGFGALCVRLGGFGLLHDGGLGLGGPLDGGLGVDLGEDARLGVARLGARSFANHICCSVGLE